MPSDSDGSYSEMEIVDNGQWKKVRHKRKSRVETMGNTNKTNRLSQEDINNTIIGSNTNTTKNTEINTHTKNIQDKNISIHTNKNYSARMNEIVHKKFKHLFYITTVNDITRKDMSEIWETAQPQSDEVIIQTKKGFLIKTNKEKKIITETLNKLISNKKIKNYQETLDSYTPSHDRPTTSSSYSVIIGSVQHEITDSEISEHTKRMNIKHRYCKRIIAKVNNKPTLMIRIITDCLKSSEQLLNEGVFYKHKHYPTFSSLPPAPIPQPCSRCLQFTHTKEQCTTSIKCTKCNGPHHYSKCNPPLPMKCTGCGSEEHVTWSFKCPKRPTQPIQGQRPAAIVTPIEGTTRDILEVTLNIDGYPLVLADTAGLRLNTNDIVEKEGIKRALKLYEKSDLILLVIDSQKFVEWKRNSPDTNLSEYVKDYVGKLNLNHLLNYDEEHFSNLFNKSCIIVLNKSDLGDIEMCKIIEENVVKISCKTEEGVTNLVKTISHKLKILCGEPSQDHPSMNQLRHRQHLTDCLNYLHLFLKEVSNDTDVEVSLDLVLMAEYIRKALRHLGKLVGIVTTEQILNVIFKDFCIGK